MMLEQEREPDKPHCQGGRSGGLEIVGFDPEEDLAAATGFLAKHPASWTESIAATPGNVDVERLVTERFGIRSYPSSIVVDPSGQVIAMVGSDHARLAALLEEKVEK